MRNFEIDADTWFALNSLLDHALDLPACDRMPWIDALGPEYAALKPRLRDLISRSAALRTAELLGTIPTLSDLTGEGSEALPLGAGDIVGAYRLVRPLGEGGMGAVWLAERNDGLIARPVALKLPRASWRSLILADRMAREREILATLNHPNIARLYDAGITRDGQPFLALEYVEGRRIDEFIVQSGLDLRRLIALFLQVTDAVAHAHSQLVVHRDLKPSNILVTASGHAMLLDFGIAKMLEQGEARETELTEQSGRALTPDYASPEQIAGATIGTASDVYSLGVVLYELLTRSRPYRLKRNSRGSLEDAILETDPLRPSDVVEDRSLRKALRGDLDWIVLKAMAKERDRRYSSAAELAADLRRFLRDEPVEASPPSTTYRLSKFVRRHRLGVAAAALLALTLIAGTAGTTAGMLRARRAEASALTEAATAERYSDFLVNMFETASPEESKGRDITARDILTRGAARIRKELANEPLLEARLLTTIGYVYTELGAYPDARPALDEAVALARRSGKKGKLDLARALTRRGQIEQHLDEARKAESDEREALAILEGVYGPNNLKLEPAMSELGLVLRTRDPDQALRLYRRSYDLLKAVHREAQDGYAAVLLGNIGSIHFRAQRFEDAKEAYERALPVLTQHFGEKDPRVGAVEVNLSGVYRSLGDYARAYQMGQRALDVDTFVSGPDHPDAGIDWLNLARISNKLGEDGRALAQIDRSIEIFKRRFAATHPLRIMAANFRAGYLIELRRFDEARKTLQSAAVSDAPSVEAKVALLKARLILADIERLEGKASKSEELAEAVLADPAVRSDQRLEADARWAHAYALAAQAKTEQAESERTHALQIESQIAQGIAFPGAFAHAKYRVCAGDPAGAIAILREAVTKGFHDPIVLNDPTLAALRREPDFASLAGAIVPHSAPAPQQ